MKAELNARKRKEAKPDLLTILDMLPALVVSALPDGSVDFINGRWQEFTGRSLRELSGRNWQNAIHPEDLFSFLEQWDTDLTADCPFANEVRVRRADGEYCWFLIHKVALHDSMGNIVRWYGVGYEIEDRERAEDRLRLVVDTTPAQIHTARPDGYIDFFNQPWLNYVGLSLDDVCGWRWTNSIHPADVEGILSKWRECLASGSPFEYEARVRRADGEYRRFLHRKVALRDEHGNIVRWFGSSSDIEDRKQAEEALAAAIRQRAEIRADERVRIARDLHDTLLQGVQALTLRFHVISQNLPENSRDRQAMEAALTSADRIVLEARNRVSHLRADYVQDKDLCRAFEAIAAEVDYENRVRFSCEVEEPMGEVMSLVVQELYYIGREAVINAFRHSHASEVAVTLRHLPKELVLTVADNGRGFDLDAQLNAPTIGHWGLRGMKERAEAVDALFECVSLSGKGTSVVVRVPSARAYCSRD